MNYDPHAMQKRIKEENRHKIISLVYQKPRTFTELLNLSGFSPMGLTKMLQDLVKEKKLFKPQKKGDPYRITSGLTGYDLTNLHNVISEIENNGGKYHIDYPEDMQSEASDYGAFLGIFTHLFLDKNIDDKLNPLTKKDIVEIQKTIFEKILYNVKHHKVTTNDSIEGKIVLGFEINYKEILKEIGKYSDKTYDALIKKRLREIKR